MERTWIYLWRIITDAHFFYSFYWSNIVPENSRKHRHTNRQSMHDASQTLFPTSAQLVNWHPVGEETRQWKFVLKAQDSVTAVGKETTCRRRSDKMISNKLRFRRKFYGARMQKKRRLINISSESMPLWRRTAPSEDSFIQQRNRWIVSSAGAKYQYNEERGRKKRKKKGQEGFFFFAFRLYPQCLQLQRSRLN